MEEADPLVNEEMTAIDVPPPHKGGQSDAEDVATLQKQATGSQMEQREQREGAQGARSLLQVERRPVGLRDNETIQGDTFFSLSDHSSWSSNEQLDLEADKTSSEFESEVSSLALGKELQESGRSATVRKKQRKRSEQVGPNKHSTNPLDTKGLQGLQWEYSKDDLTLFDNGEKQPNPVSLETIYQSIMEHREESKLESCRTQMACRKMQIQIRRVAKTCSEFTTWMEEAETRISRLEDEAGARQSSREMHERTCVSELCRPGLLLLHSGPGHPQEGPPRQLEDAERPRGYNPAIGREPRVPISAAGPRGGSGLGRVRVLLAWRLGAAAAEDTAQEAKSP
ncbi:hypothetical protein NDU88_006084 [Pleurodeles waltl]|uniref:Uncharacterized protein n=1 Tax=Pleurodeles waltl TaxID=8319 RepID=A0AAV7QJT9_PLEWA|nr:hypothetical protein NDU88_006084 [Pleurodeles waltl]